MGGMTPPRSAPADDEPRAPAAKAERRRLTPSWVPVFALILAVTVVLIVLFAT